MRNKSTTRHVGAAILASALLLTATSPARAAIPPYWQRVAEVKAILESGEIARALKNNPVDGIERRGVDLYSLRAGKCRLDVRIIGEPQTIEGPRQFRIEPGPVSCP